MCQSIRPEGKKLGGVASSIERPLLPSSGFQLACAPPLHRIGANDKCNFSFMCSVSSESHGYYIVNAATAT